MINIADKQLAAIAAKIERGERLSAEDGATLLRSNDLPALGQLANAVKESRTGDRAYFVLNRHLNPSNLCIMKCRFCRFSADAGDIHAYEMSMDEILEAVSGEINEVHIVGGLHPDWPFERYLEIVSNIKESRPEVRIKAWTAVEVDHFCRISGEPLESVFAALKKSGVESMPGGGAEVFSERVRAEMFPKKIGADRWLEIHAAAHSAGLTTNCTMLYGHMETIEERVEHMLRLRALQDETAGFMAFIPLPYQPGENGVVSRRVSAVEDLKVIATARLLLDNIPHIKAYWAMLGLETASLALNFGADDLDGTVGKERIAHMAGAPTPESVTREKIIGIIREARRVPVERDIRYGTIKIHDGIDGKMEAAGAK